jgi:hypothetical protein
VCVYNIYIVHMCEYHTMLQYIPHDAPVQDGRRLVAWVARPQLLVYDAFVQGARVKGVIAHVQVAFAVEEDEYLDAVDLTKL